PVRRSNNVVGTRGDVAHLVTQPQYRVNRPLSKSERYPETPVIVSPGQVHFYDSSCGPSLDLTTHVDPVNGDAVSNFIVIRWNRVSKPVLHYKSKNLCDVPH